MIYKKTYNKVHVGSIIRWVTWDLDYYGIILKKENNGFLIHWLNTKQEDFVDNKWIWFNSFINRKIRLSIG